MYEMFLVRWSKASHGILTVLRAYSKFLRKFWRLFHDADWNFSVNNAEPSKAELKSLHKIIQRWSRISSVSRSILPYPAL